MLQTTTETATASKKRKKKRSAWDVLQEMSIHDASGKVLTQEEISAIVNDRKTREATPLYSETGMRLSLLALCWLSDKWKYSEGGIMDMRAVLK
jgi:hypothetical protein